MIAALFAATVCTATLRAEINDISHAARLLSQYLQRQVKDGRLRPHDTAIGARSFLGMFVVNVVAREIMHDPSAMATSDEQLVATVLDIFLGGLEIVEE